jgi:hypothetical protein
MLAAVGMNLGDSRRIRMTRSLVLALLVTSLALALPASPAMGAPGPGCLPGPLPTSPGRNPAFTTEVQDVADRLSVTLWRQPCQDSADSVLLLRATPTSAAPSLCGTRWYLKQDTHQFYVTFGSVVASADGPGREFCERITAPVTVVVRTGDLAGGDPGSFEIEDDFDLFFYGSFGGPYVVFTIEVPYAGPPSPTITVVATRCNPCRSGQTVAIEARVDNPSPAGPAEIKAAARLPDGRVVSLVNTVATLASGASVITVVPAQSLPMGLPAIDVLVEAAILDPVLGRTLSRHALTLRLLP